MSAWGTGIKQRNEFMDVYDEFPDLYVDDADPIEICKQILEEYRSEFSGEHRLLFLYTVYYALATCLWECGKKDSWLWEEIDRILLSHLDITADYNNRAGLLFTPTMAGCTSIGERAFFYDLSKAESTMKRNGM